MKILFTGASSFTGSWFVRALARDGHKVLAVFQKPREEYTDTRGLRLEAVETICEPRYSISFGTNAFLELLEKEKVDLLCHHAADVTNYRSFDFDYVQALSTNTKNLRRILPLLKNTNAGVILTGSIFEGGEGASPHTITPYGLSKKITRSAFEYFCDYYKVRLGHFIVPNPFGPLEEPRFTKYLVQTWAKGETPHLRTPDYLRDNIHVDLLALAYARFVKDFRDGNEILRPSGYAEKQGAFADRFAREFSKRANREFQIIHDKQIEFDEPMVKINATPARQLCPQWREEAAWDALFEYYKPTLNL